MSGNRFRKRDRARQALAWVGGLLGDGVRLGVRLAVLAALVGGVGYLGWKAVLRSPYFTVRVVEADATAHLSRAEIVSTLGLDAPRNLFEFDAEAAAEALRTHPWVARAEVRTRLPGRVEVSLQERSAEGVVVLDELYLVDGTGTPFARPTPGEAIGHTLVTGLDRADFERAPALTRARVRDALALGRLYDQRPLAQARPLSAVHLGQGRRCELHLGRTRVVLGIAGFDQKLIFLEKIFKKLNQRKMDADYILLSEDGRRAIVNERAKRSRIELPGEIQGSLSVRPGDDQKEVSN